MKKIVLVNVDFIDAYTGQLHKAGERVEMTDERIAEVKAVIPEGVSVVGKVEEPTEAAVEDSTEPAEEPAVPAEKPKRGKKSE